MDSTGDSNLSLKDHFQLTFMTIFNLLISSRATNYISHCMMVVASQCCYEPAVHPNPVGQSWKKSVPRTLEAVIAAKGASSTEEKYYYFSSFLKIKGA